MHSTSDLHINQHPSLHALSPQYLNIDATMSLVPHRYLLQYRRSTQSRAAVEIARLLYDKVRADALHAPPDMYRYYWSDFWGEREGARNKLNQSPFVPGCCFKSIFLCQWYPTGRSGAAKCFRRWRREGSYLDISAPPTSAVFSPDRRPHSCLVCLSRRLFCTSVSILLLSHPLVVVHRLPTTQSTCLYI